MRSMRILHAMEGSDGDLQTILDVWPVPQPDLRKMMAGVIKATMEATKARR